MRLTEIVHITIALCGMLVFTGVACTTIKDQPAVEYNPQEDLYQKGEETIFTNHLVPVVVPDPVTPEEMEQKMETERIKQSAKIKMEQEASEAKNKDREHAWGSVCKVIGWILIGAGFCVHLAVSLPAVKSIASSVITGGFCAIISGLGMQKTVEHDEIGTIAIAVLVVGWLCWKFKDFSVSRIKSWFGNKKEKGAIPCECQCCNKQFLAIPGDDVKCPVCGAPRAQIIMQVEKQQQQ